jgi:hypothetical protein
MRAPAAVRATALSLDDEKHRDPNLSTRIGQKDCHFGAHCVVELVKSLCDCVILTR